jgi:hypothetical protein
MSCFGRAFLALLTFTICGFGQSDQGTKIQSQPLLQLQHWPTSAWIVMIAGAGIVIRVIFVHLFPKRRFSVAFEELSAGKETRRDKDRALTALAIELLTPKQLSDDEFSMDIMPGTDEPGFSGVMPALEPNGDITYEASDHPVKIAAVEFVPQQIIALFGWLRRPSRECIEGWVDCNDGDAFASATYKRRWHLFRPFDGTSTRHWSFRRSGSSARDEVLSLLTAHIIIDLRKADFTRSPQSYHELRKAMRSTILDNTDSKERDLLVSSRRQHLEAALSYDPKNWIARFSLGLELCKGGFPHEAVEQFELLEKLIEKVLSQTPPGQTLPY